MLSNLSTDFRFGLRTLARSPGFTLTAVAALALGIGANTAVFSVVNAALLAPLHLLDPDRIVQVRTTGPEGVNPGASPAKFAYWRTLDDIFEDVASTQWSAVNYGEGDTSEQIYGEKVSASFFRLYGGEIVQGRGFTAEEDSPNGPRVAVISHEFWERRFAADPEALGQMVLLGGVPYTLVGVLSPEFSMAEFRTAPPDVFIPFQLDPNAADQAHYFFVGARLKSGVSLDEAQARLAASTGAFRERFPDFNPNDVFTAVSLRDAAVAYARETLLVLMAAVGLVLLIACANAANLLLARAAGRRREMAVRSAIGAGRGRIIRQLLIESLILAAASGALGLFLGSAGIHALLSINTAGLPRLGPGGAFVVIDWRVAAFTIGASALTGLLFGLIPALQSSRVDLTGALKDGGRSGSGASHNRTRSLLVVSEVALALVLLIGSTLLIRTSIALSSVDPGFDASNVLMVRMSLADQRFSTTHAVERLVQNGVQRLELLPGVVTAATTCCVPLQPSPSWPFVIASRPLEGTDHGRGYWTTVSPGFFEVFKIPLSRGRLFDARDGSSGPPAVIINETMARRFWPEGNALGDRLIIGRDIMQEFADEPAREIIGIVADARDTGLTSDPEPRMYVPSAQISDGATILHASFAPMAWVIRTSEPSPSLTERIQTEIRQVSGLPVYSVGSMENLVAYSQSPQRFNMWLMTAFGLAALALAAIGICGLMAYAVQQRRQEIGIRLALGARPDQIRRMVLLQGLKLAAMGGVIGLAAAYGLSRFLSSFLFGVEADDSLTFVIVPFLLGLIALLAVGLPALRASRIEPSEALRCE